MDALSDLHLFKEIVEAGSFVSAAARLDITPSAVSKRLSRYELRLGVRLLNRTTRSLSLTEAGETLFLRGRNILEEVELAELASIDAATKPSGGLRVACSDAFALHVLLPMLQTFQSTYPDVRINVLQGDGPIDMVTERIDVAIRFEQPTNTDFVVRPLIEDPWVVCASPSYLVQHGAPQHPYELATHRCLTIRARDVESADWIFRQGDQRATVTVNSVFSGIGLVVKQAALNGLGIARLAHFLVRESIRQGELVQLFKAFEPADKRSIYVVYPHRDFLPLKVRLFVDHISQHMTMPR